MVSEAQKRATAKYMKENQKQYLLKVNKKTEPELLAWIESIENKQGYIKSLIMADMNVESIGAVTDTQIIQAQAKQIAELKAKIRKMEQERNLTEKSLDVLTDMQNNEEIDEKENPVPPQKKKKKYRKKTRKVKMTPYQTWLNSSWKINVRKK